MKILKFKPHLVEPILTGEKTTTWRLFDDKDLQVRDELIFQNSETGENFAEAEIISINEKKLKEIKEGDYNGHETYKDLKTMVDHFKIYYGDKVTQETIVKIITFKIRYD